MTLTNDQYYGLAKLIKWYNKYQNQIIEISGVVGTGTLDLVQEFIEQTGLDPREICYLSYNQKQVLDLAYKKLHAYYINGIIYNYTRIVDFDTIPVLNPRSNELKYEWKKSIKKKIDEHYKLIVVFDSLLLNRGTLDDLASFGIPIILIRDPMLLPAPDTYTFLRDANIELNDVQPQYLRNPIIYFAHKVLNREPLKYGNYDTVSVVPKKQLNLYNLKSSDMNITISNELMKNVNHVFRERVLGRKTPVNIVGERVIVSETLYGEKLVNQDNKKVKVYLTKGTVGTLTKVNKHALNTKYVPCDFRPDFYHEPFVDLVMDRHHLNGIDLPSQQMLPDERIKFDYAYALTPALARLNHWEKITLIVDENEYENPRLQQVLLYTAITRTKRSLTIVQ